VTAIPGTGDQKILHSCDSDNLTSGHIVKENAKGYAARIGESVQSGVGMPLTNAAKELCRLAMREGCDRRFLGHLELPDDDPTNAAGLPRRYDSIQAD
jgi:hypothetical protein